MKQIIQPTIRIYQSENDYWRIREFLREADGWKFAQMNFSFPTIYFPDVRLFE